MVKEFRRKTGRRRLGPVRILNKLDHDVLWIVLDGPGVICNTRFVVFEWFSIFEFDKAAIVQIFIGRREEPRVVTGF